MLDPKFLDQDQARDEILEVLYDSDVSEYTIFNSKIDPMSILGDILLIGFYDNDTLAGFVTVEIINEDYAYLGYYLKKAYQGKGHGKQLSVGVKQYINRVMNKKAAATVDVRNKASIRLIEKLGLQFFMEYSHKMGDGSYTRRYLYIEGE